MTTPAVALLAAAALLLSGCTSAPGPAAQATDADGNPMAGGAADPSVQPAVQPASGGKDADGDAKLRLRGTVFTPSLHPIANATVAVIGLDEAQVTGVDGGFDFGDVDRGIYALTATAAGYLATTLTIPPEHQGTIRLVLEPGEPVVAYNTTVHFRGILECAFEAVLISPSCDSALTAAMAEAGQQFALFDTNQSLLFTAERGWRTLVVDVVFDGEAHPGLDGLRIAVRGSLDPDGGGAYTQYGRWHGPDSFAARLEPGGSYPDGTEAVPDNATGFQVDVYPHSHAYHPAEQGFLGVGFAQDVEFDLYATLFYVDPAPEGWSFVGAGA